MRASTSSASARRRTSPGSADCSSTASTRTSGTRSRSFSDASPATGTRLARPSRLIHMLELGTMRVKTGLAEMLKGGVIMDVVDADQARIAEEAGAVAVMALERVPADIRADGGVARMSDPDMIQQIIAAVSIPVMAKC